jgi:predicted alpha/beta hydrolase family esterase
MIAAANFPAHCFSIIALVDGTAPPAMAQMLRQQRAQAIPLRLSTPSERNLLAARIDRFMADADRAVVMVANGAGCLAAAWWARLSPTDYVARVAGAILIDPRQPDAAGAAPIRDAFASPATRLPFPSILVDGGEGRRALSSMLAREWGSETVQGSATSPTTRGGRAFQLLERLTNAVVEREVRAAERLANLRR